MERTPNAMAVKIVEIYHQPPNYKKAPDELGVNEKTLKKYVDPDRALASQRAASSKLLQANFRFSNPALTTMCGFAKMDL